METDLYPNVQALRTMWSRKVQEEEKIFQPRSTVYRSSGAMKKKPTVTFDHVGKIH